MISVKNILDIIELALGDSIAIYSNKDVDPFNYDEVSIFERKNDLGLIEEITASQVYYTENKDLAYEEAKQYLNKEVVVLKSDLTFSENESYDGEMESYLDGVNYAIVIKSIT